MKFEHTQVFNFEGALRGMRNPLESWSKSDSYYEGSDYIISPNDMSLAQRLIKGGSEHRKFLRSLFVSVDITAPMYYFSEFDTYKLGTVANSTSKMHKIMSRPFTIDMFEIDDLEPFERVDFKEVLRTCNKYRNLYLEYKDDDPIMAKKYWKALIRILPESWLQTRTVTMNYEVVRNMVHQRKGHKLVEWHKFIDWAEALPYAKEFIFYEN